ncbi:hypothetical protein DCAR_0622927 [Daucus carota subsp. sativus]|uniref:SET domain-containing protein n=1 Tax=Daucus carota subsp. sativus TaxID=79200 RepID=A0AAF0X8S0_DAUCS|nr:hypothetical protein DCAR_0622927 [Daucus carota subsp. sativus]
MNLEPHKHYLFKCQDCPLERAKNSCKPEPCKGHLVRKFIKECWRKCGCSMLCGNRVVQSGVTRNLHNYDSYSTVSTSAYYVIVYMYYVLRKRVLRDEDDLCLDETLYGNIARFINHRCHDGNFLAIPVEIESSDHHYYHIDFFTKEKVSALEELTWKEWVKLYIGKVFQN